MKKIIGGILVAVGIIHAFGCLVGKHFPSLIISAAIIGVGVFLITKTPAKKDI